MPEKEICVGDLVKVRFSAYSLGNLPADIRDIPYDEIGLVIRREANVCVAVFLYPEERVMSFLIDQLQVVSKVEKNSCLFEAGSYIDFVPKEDS